jgi:hypothetical protein
MHCSGLELAFFVAGLRRGGLATGSLRVSGAALS